MTARLNPSAAHFALIKPLIDYSRTVQDGLDPALAHLVEIRASQINGCAVCLHMHARDARAHGETEMRIYVLDAWRDSPLYTERERAALAWTDALTRVHEAGAPDEAYQALQQHFTEEEQIRITLLIGAINAWNRLNVGFHVQHAVTGADRAA